METEYEQCSTRMQRSRRQAWLLPGACICLAVACATAYDRAHVYPPPPPVPWGDPPDTKIATVENNGVQYLVYAPPSIFVPFDRDTQVKWFSTEGPFTISIQEPRPTPLGNVRIVNSTSAPPYTATANVPKGTPKGTYHYGVGLFSEAHKKLVLDIECPPIIVGP